jgi:aminoglycoside phosphotransferase family enzyme/predicted kinase
MRPELAGFETQEVRETHISWVFLGADEVLKIKKPVALGFLDFGTLEKRRRACEAEVELNRRLAPDDVYRGAVPLFQAPDGRLGLEENGVPAEWAVRMRRLPDEARADVRLRRGQLRKRDVDVVASLLARFHERARVDAVTSSFGRPDRVAYNVQENFAQVGALPVELVGLRSALEIEVRQLEFLRAHGELFQKRIDDGRVRDGHGDLRLEHVYLSAGADPVVLDCIEFDDRFRFADVCADIAFLSMDLARMGRADLAERLLARYARESNDFELYALIDFYESYRAYVRGKIACLSLASGAARPEMASEARTCFLLALAAVRPPLVPPVVVAVGGLPGTGKSTIADRLSFELGCPVIEADRTRKHLHGVSASTALGSHAWQGAYSTETTERVYGELVRRAAVVLDSGRAVVLDASFRSPELRTLAKSLAEHNDVAFLFVECTAPSAICRERLARRDRATTASDAGPAEYDVLAARYVAPLELGDACLRVDTERSPDHVVATVRSRLAR